MKVLLEKGVWLSGEPSSCDGDPPRTTIEENAYEFDSSEQAYKALKEARAYRRFDKAEIVEDFF